MPPDLRQARAGPLRGYLYQRAAGLGWTSLPFLPLIRQPTLVLAGDDDPIIPLANARILAALIPSARLHVYNGGHLELVTRPGLLAPWSPACWPSAARAKPHPCPDITPDQPIQALPLFRRLFFSRSNRYSSAVAVHGERRQHVLRARSAHRPLEARRAWVAESSNCSACGHL